MYDHSDLKLNHPPEEMRAVQAWTKPDKIRVDFQKMGAQVPLEILDCVQTGENYKNIKEIALLQQRQKKFTNQMGSYIDKDLSFYKSLGEDGKEIAKHITWHDNVEGEGGRFVYDDANFPPVHLDTQREEWDEVVALLAQNDVGHATIGKLLVQHKQAATMIQRIKEDSA